MRNSDSSQNRQRRMPNRNGRDGALLYMRIFSCNKDITVMLAEQAMDLRLPAAAAYRRW